MFLTSGSIPLQAMRGCVLGKDTLRLFPNRAKPGAYLGEGPLGHGLQNCIEK